MQKLYKVVGVLLLGLFSFFYTEKVIDLIRESDPIMRNIKKSESDYKIDPVDAKIKDNKIIPGISGKVIDYDSSYKKMKKYGTYKFLKKNYQLYLLMIIMINILLKEAGSIMMLV